MNVGGRWFKYHLKLMVFEETVGIFAVAAVGGAAAGLDVDHAIRLGTEDAEECFRMHRAGANFDVVGLLEYAALVGPEFFELEDEILKREASRLCCCRLVRRLGDLCGSILRLPEFARFEALFAVPFDPVEKMRGEFMNREARQLFLH